MKADLHQAWKWRLRASQLRMHADTVRDAQARTTLLMLAHEWEQRAVRAERRGVYPAGDPEGRPRRR